MKSVLILGANFAGLQAAAALPRHRQVTVVDSASQFEWTPNIHEILSGVKQASSVALDRPKILSRLGHRFIQAPVSGLDAQARTVTLGDGRTLAFDCCLLATGLTHDYHQVPGAQAHTLGFRSAGEVVRIHAALQALLARDRPVQVTLIGGGYSGIEALGELLRRHRHDPRLRIRVLERHPRLLAGLPEVIARDIEALCAPYPVEIHCGVALQAISASAVTLHTGPPLHSDLTLWCAGTTGPAFLRDSGLNLDARGMVPVDAHLQASSGAGIFAAGDLAAFEPALLKQAYHAMDMGTRAGRNIERLLRNQPLRPFVPAEKPVALAFGDLTTYLIQGQTVLASPLLAMAKEAVYQLYMAQLSRSLPLAELTEGLFSRALGSVRNQLLPEISRLHLLRILRQSMVLQWGGFKDTEAFVRALVISATR